MEETTSDPQWNVTQLLDRLLGRAFLFADPAAFEAGVRETLELVSTAVPGVAAPPLSGGDPRAGATRSA